MRRVNEKDAFVDESESAIVDPIKRSGPMTARHDVVKKVDPLDPGIIQLILFTVCQNS